MRYNIQTNVMLRNMKRASARKRSYHHGDLANAALAEALVVLEEQGPQAVTFAEVARRLGVSAAALYRHYADPEALLAAVTRESFALFAQALQSVTPKAPLERLRAMVDAYLAFALKHPARYLLMFNTRLDNRAAALAHAGDPAFLALLEALAACAPGVGEETLVALGKQVWALSHGFAALIQVGAISLSRAQVRELTWAGVRQLLGGLGAHPPRAACDRPAAPSARPPRKARPRRT